VKFDNLKKVYPYPSDIKEAVKAILFIGGFVFLFVLIFRSDQFILDFDWIKRIKLSAVFGIMAMIIPFLNILIVNLVLSSKKKINWRVIDEALLYILHFATISIANYIFTLYLMADQFAILDFLRTILITVITGGIPVSLYLLSQQKKLLQENSDSAVEINESAKHQQERSIQNEILTLNSQEIDLDYVLYFESDRNYIKVVFKSNPTLRIRGTITNVEELVSGSSTFFRCHRAFIVNLYFIENVTGNAQGLRLDLGEDTVPVSRKYIPEIRTLLQSSPT